MKRVIGFCLLFLGATSAVAAPWLIARFKVANFQAVYGLDDQPLPFSITHIVDRNTGACFMVLRDSNTGYFAMEEVTEDRCR